jgi:ketosteroid isomerase-like protein
MYSVERDTAQVVSEENVQLVREFLNTFIEVDEGLADTGRLYEFVMPDVTLDLSGDFELAGKTETHGLDEFLEWRAGWFEAYDDYDYNAEKILEAGANRVVATFRQRGKPVGSESWVEMRYGFVYTVEDGLITRVRVYATPEEALEAAGQRE